MRRFHPFVKRPVHVVPSPNGPQRTFATAPAPLSPEALSVLVRADKAPVICKGVNPGIVRKLTTEGWASLVGVPNPYQHRLTPQAARTVQALAITEKGKARIAFDEQ